MAPRIAPGRLAGGSIALLAGAAAVVASRLTHVVGPLGGLPVLELLGVGYAALLGAYLGPRLVRAPADKAVVLTLLYGVVVPALVAATIVPVPPLIFIAVAFSVAVWPLTLPAAGVWAAVLRWQRARLVFDRALFATVALGLTIAVLGWRYSQPLVTGSPGRELCASFPGEQIELIAWSPNGRWLGIVSDRDYATQSIRVLDPATGQIAVVVSGSDLDAEFGLVVGDDGSISYQTSRAASQPPPDDFVYELRRANAGAPSTLIGTMPTLVSLTGTPEGLAGAPLDDEGPRAVWLRSAGAAVDFVPLTPDELADVPELGIRLAEFDGSFRVATPTGIVEVEQPEDSDGVMSITPDHRYLVLVARRVTDDGYLADEQLVAQSVATGERLLLRDGGDAWDARIAGGRIASLTSIGSENRVCLEPLEPTLGLGAT